METSTPTAAQRVLGTPELLEMILIALLNRIPPPDARGYNGPQSIRTRVRARLLMHVLRCGQVARNWQACIMSSCQLKKGLFLKVDDSVPQSWDRTGPDTASNQPILNPIIVYMYDFSFTIPRFPVPGNALGDRHCVHFYLNRACYERDHEEGTKRTRCGSISDMLLSQPPCFALREDGIVGRSGLGDSVISCDTGITLGLLNEKAGHMFDDHERRASQMPVALREPDGLMLFSG